MGMTFDATLKDLGRDCPHGVLTEFDQPPSAGIEPANGRIWFGESIQDVVAQRDADGSDAPLFFVRVGSAAYYQKGGHR